MHGRAGATTTELRRVDTARESGLDAIRFIALIRVILWHTFGAAVITYVVAAVPAMFFVTGSLLAKSLARRGARVVVGDRLRRLLVPLAIYSSISIFVMTYAYWKDPSDATAVPLRGLWVWFVPLTDPKGSAWEGGYLSSALWYMRTLIWLIVLAPLLLRLVRRWSFAALALPAATVLALDLVSRRPGWSIGALPDLVWQAGDVALYSLFLMLGFLHRQGALACVTKAGWLAVAGAAGAAATWWGLTQPVPNGIVNDSHPMHLLVGLGWLALALAVLPWLARIADADRVAPIVRAVTRRSLTVYLWHPAAIVLAYRSVDRFDLSTPVFVIAVLVVVAAMTAALTSVFGSVEDRAAGRRVRPPRAALAAPRASFSIGLIVVLLFALAPAQPRSLLQQSTSASAPDLQVAAASVLPATASRRPPVPSQAPVRASAADSALVRSMAAPVLTGLASTARETPPLQSVVSGWAAQFGLTGVQVGALHDGVFSLASTGASLNTSFELLSITKTYTAAIIYQLADEGLVDLDAPLPVLSAVPEFPYSDTLTIRILLSHKSGLVNYRDTQVAAVDPLAIDSPAEAIRASTSAPLKFEPGTSVDYSSTNYLILGLIAEQVTSKDFDTLLRERIIEPLALTSVGHVPPRPGEPNFSTAGITTDVIDLLRWGRALFADEAVISQQSLSVMTALGDAGLGAGASGWCPCVVAEDETVTFHFIGHADAHTLLVYSAADDLVLAITFEQNLYEGTNVAALDVLIDAVRGYVLSV